MNDQIKKLNEEAANLHAQAKAILDEYDGKEMPKEKAQQADALLDEVEAKTAQAKRLARVDAQNEFLNKPGAKPQMFTDGAGKGADDEDDDDLETLQRKYGQRSKRYDRKPDTSVAGNAFRKALYGQQAMFALSEEERKAILPGMQRKDLAADQSDAGGTLVAPQEFVARLIKFLDDEVYVRGLATVETITAAQSLGAPTLEADVSDADWTSEIATGTKDTGLRTGKRELFPHPLAKRVLMSRKFLRMSSIPADALVRDRLGYKFAVAQENGFLNGNGANQPLGVFVAHAQGISTARDYVAADDATLVGDDIINVFEHLKPQYQRRATWMMHRLVMREIRKIKTSQGEYIWQPGLSTERPATILDRPYVLSEYAPYNSATVPLAASNYAAVIGDFSFYWIVDALNMEVQVVDQLYAETNQIGYIGRMEVDGAPILEEAFARLKLAAS